ncbi:hypothetical protein [uncultured Chryseobacterium sp.]|uniref:hypothetical protein n=1 Tax=uncultured Chryseobacterium sp. TaxID=259322 RepID=UPI0026304E47|nr:hypothetical protein [uncultured Chryseobacterium sp.]
MRLNNRNKSGLYNFLMMLLLMLLFAGIIGFLLERYKFDILGWESSFLIILPVLLLAIFFIRGRQIFEYDSDGEALNFKNRNIMLFLDKPLNDEFPKYKLMKYEVVNALIFKRLYITISSKKNNATILKYDISYLTKKQLMDLKVSLSKVVRTNQENKRETNS